VLSRAAELLGLVPVFPVRNIGTFGSGEAGTSGGDRAAVFRDCVLVRKGSTVGDAFRKIMGDAPLAYVETIGGVRVSEDDEVKVGKNDVSVLWKHLTSCVTSLTSAQVLSFKVGRA
jgi:hypothetical protein